LKHRLAEKKKICVIQTSWNCETVDLNAENVPKFTACQLHYINERYDDDVWFQIMKKNVTNIPGCFNVNFSSSRELLCKHGPKIFKSNKNRRMIFDENLVLEFIKHKFSLDDVNSFTGLHHDSWQKHFDQINLPTYKKYAHFVHAGFEVNPLPKEITHLDIAQVYENNTNTNYFLEACKKYGATFDGNMLAKVFKPNGKYCLKLGNRDIYFSQQCGKNFMKIVTNEMCNKSDQSPELTALLKHVTVEIKPMILEFNLEQFESYLSCSSMFVENAFRDLNIRITRESLTKDVEIGKDYFVINDAKYDKNGNYDSKSSKGFDLYKKLLEYCI